MARSRIHTWSSTIVVALAFSAAHAAALDLDLDAYDVPTVFYVAKSDDRNRVDYGIRLDERCRPATDEPVFAYWRRFEPGEPRLGELNMFDQQVYGITSQHVASSTEGGSWISVEIRAVPNERLLILVQPDPSDRGCRARLRMRLNGRPAWADHAFVQLAGPMSIDRVIFYGRDVETNARVREVRTP